MISPPNSLRIGGEFEFFPADYGEPSRSEFGARFGSSHVLWTDCGRSALLIAASVIKARGGIPRVWLPAYSCASITQAFDQVNFDIEYYSVGLNLSGESLPLPQPAAGETLLFIHYFGHRNSRMAAAVHEYRAAGVWVIEDCVQAGLMPRFEGQSDFSVTSLRKLLPVVDGAALLSKLPLDLADCDLQLELPDESFVSEKLMGKILRATNARDADFLSLLESAENRLEGYILPRHVSWLSSWMMERTDFNDAVAKRRINWQQLFEGIVRTGLADLASPLFHALTADDVPLGLPVRVSDGRRDELRHFLATKNVYCPVHWPLGHLPADRPFESERKLEHSLLTLPIDQRLSEKHIAHILEKLKAFFGHTRS